MDALIAEIAAKKAALNGGSPADPSSSSAAGSSRYLKRSEIEAMERQKAEDAARAKREAARETLRKEREAREAKKAGKGKAGPSSVKETTTTTSTTTTPNPSLTDPAPTAEPDRLLPPAEISRRLRSRGKPIRFFGETDKDRFERLRALEIGDSDGRRAGGRVDEFRSMLKGVEDEMMARDSERAGKRRRVERDGAVGKVGIEGRQEGEGGGGVEVVKADGQVKEGQEGDAKVDGGDRGAAVGPIDLELLRVDISKLHPQVYWFLKNLLKEWEAWLEERPDDVKRSMEGKLASANWIQSATNLKPLFKQLRTRVIPLDVLAKLAEIGHDANTRQYQKANDAYLRLSIGNAAWPIGVTSVGMHERGARERIQTDVVAHVLNDEVSRKWIQAVKRLITFCQMVRPPKEHAQRMG